MANYFAPLGRKWQNIFRRDTPRYVEKAFDSAKEYVDFRNPDYRGMLLLFDESRHFERMFANRDLTRIEGRNMKKKREEVGDYLIMRGKRVLDSHTLEFYDMIGHHGESPDGMEGAVAIDLDGRYVDSGIFIEGVSTRGVQVLADTGARHRAGAFASKNLVDYALVVSEETGRVTVFREGKTHKGMSYTPKPKHRPAYEEKDLFSDDQ